MAWAKVDDGFPDHDKVADAGARLERGQRRECSTGATGEGRVIAVWLSATCYSNAKLTDGFITDAVARRFHCDHDPIAVLRAMQHGAKGLARKVAGGWRLINFHEYQPTKKDVEAKRAEARERMRNLRGKRGKRSRNVRANTSECSREVRETFATPVPSPVPSDQKQDQDPRLAPRPFTLRVVENSGPTQKTSNDSGRKSTDRPCGKPVEKPRPSVRVLSRLAREVLKEDVRRYLADGVEFAETVKTRAARAGMVYDGSSIGKATRAAEAWLSRGSKVAS